MENSILLAKFFGIAYIVMAIGMLFNMETYQKLMDDFFKNTAVIFFGGLMALFIGLFVVLIHNVWILRWPVLITLFGWGGVIKGIWLIVFPDTVPVFARAYVENKSTFLIHAFVALIIGVILAFFGYFVR